MGDNEMKIKAIYDKYENYKEEVVIVGFSEWHAICINKFGRLICANTEHLEIIDKYYLDLLKENNNEH